MGWARIWVLGGHSQLAQAAILPPSSALAAMETIVAPASKAAVKNPTLITLSFMI